MPTSAMSNHHLCQLPQKKETALPKLPANASLCARLRRTFRSLSIPDPKSKRCLFFFHNKSAVLAEQRRHVKGPYSFMIHPLSHTCVYLEGTFFIVWLYKMVVDPVYNNMIDEIYIVRLLHSYVLFPVQLLLVLSFFFVGYVDDKTKEVVLETKTVAIRYLKTYFFCDLMASEIIDTGVIPVIKHLKDMSERFVEIIHFSHLPFLYMRVDTIITFLNHVGQVLRMRKAFRRSICYAIKTFLYIHLFSCLLYLLPQIMYTHDWPSDSWLFQANITMKHGIPAGIVYGQCFLMTMCYFFGASAGQFRVVQTNEEIALTVIAFCGRVYTLFLLADVLNMFGVIGLSESSYESQMSILKEYMACHNLPASLKSRVVKFYDCKLQKRYFNEAEILGSLSDLLRAEIFLFSARNAVSESNVFKLLPQEDIAKLISMMRLKSFAPGDLIFKCGQMHEHVYLISTGVIAVKNSRGLELCHLEDGAIFGLCNFVFGLSQYCPLVIETSDLFVVHYKEFFEFLKHHPKAIGYVREEAKSRLALYKQVEESYKKDIDTCLVELKNGSLLEKKRKRPTI